MTHWRTKHIGRLTDRDVIAFAVAAGLFVAANFIGGIWP